ncbi:hypothetical protein, partial [Paraburkholderia sp. RL17-373-BIF-A]|uniref:hypothetical protein n=1 Tax=Paraburkholderia sp. RL17-373-BIF-A TaxID=3031629 RepID=UPI0038BCC087
YPAPLRSASLHQQQRNEIMKALFRFVNNIFSLSLKTLWRYGRWFLPRPSFANEEANLRRTSAI